MPSPAAQRRKADPLKGVTTEIRDCMRELDRQRRVVQKLEEKLQSLLTKHLDLVDKLKDGM